MYTVYEHVFPNGKRYIGITCQDVRKRWQNGNGYKTQYFMNLAIEKYGWENIKHNILETQLTKWEAKNKEKYYISKYKTDKLSCGYNRTPGGDFHTCKSIICDGIKFDSLNNFCKQEGLSVKTVGDWLNGRTPMDLSYFNRGLRYENQKLEIIKGDFFKKKIICDGIIYESIRSFARQNNVNPGTVTHWLRGDTGMPQRWFDAGLRYLNCSNDKIRRAKR